jgi:hypothetical protein
MTVLDLAPGEIVHVRNRVIDPRSDRGICELQADTLGGPIRYWLAYADIVKLDSSSVLAWKEIREAVRRHDEAREAMVRAQARLYELGLHPGHALAKP